MNTALNFFQDTDIIISEKTLAAFLKRLPELTKRLRLLPETEQKGSLVELFINSFSLAREFSGYFRADLSDGEIDDLVFQIMLAGYLVESDNVSDYYLQIKEHFQNLQIFEPSLDELFIQRVIVEILFRGADVRSFSVDEMLKNNPKDE